MKSILAAAVASLVVGNAMAADGTINFKGEITAAACSITGGAGTTVGGAAGNQTIDVNLGKISIDSLGGTAGGSIAGGTSLNLNLDCGKTGTGLTTVKLKFNPMSGSTIDPNNESLLKNRRHRHRCRYRYLWIRWQAAEPVGERDHRCAPGFQGTKRWRRQ